VIVMKAMGAESDQEIIQMVGEEEAFAGLLVPTIQDCKQKGIFTQGQALDYMGGWRGREGEGCGYRSWECVPKDVCVCTVPFLLTLLLSRSLLQSLSLTTIHSNIFPSIHPFFHTGSQIKASPKAYSEKRRKSKVDEARDIMAHVLWCHVPAPKYNFQQKLA
jgi:hypothetical protein